MSERRLIEEWLPIGALGEESVRERRSMTALPPTYYLHVWWARRPLVASRAAVLASLLPADADHDKFLHAIGIHGDPVLTKRRIDAAKRTGEDLGLNPYGYSRAFQYTPDAKEKAILSDAVGGEIANMLVLDPTAGGGSIPFEAERLGVQAIANDLNPVAALILHATIDYPSKHGMPLVREFEELCKRFLVKAEPHYKGIFPPEPEGTIVLGYLYARTIRCQYCDGLIPLSPNWRLSSDGTGVRLLPELASGPLTPGRVCRFEIVSKLEEHSEGTVNDGDARCPYPDCARVVDGNEIKRQAQAGGMGERLYTIVYKQRIETRTKAGKVKEKWVRGFRAPRDEDDNSDLIAERLATKLPEWEANDIVPSEVFPENTNDSRPIQYGMPLWRDMFSPRQLLCHGTSVEVYRELLEMDRAAGALTDLRKASYVYLALSLDTLLNYGCRSCRWDVVTERVRSIFDRHDFAFCWSYAEMAPLVTGHGYDWANEKTAKCIEELVALVRPEEAAAAKVAAKATKRSAKGAELFFVDEDAVPPAAYVPPPVIRA